MNSSRETTVTINSKTKTKNTYNKDVIEKKLKARIQTKSSSSSDNKSNTTIIAESSKKETTMTPCPKEYRRWINT
jgi:hypothetical protein